MRFLFLLYWRCSAINKKEHAINGDIRENEIRVIDSDGSQLGILSTDKALSIASEKDLDLVMIAPLAKPPVCKIMDYGKFCFEQEKRAKEAKKNQKIIDIKEIQLSYKIGQHDFDTKVNHALKFLKGGDKVKITMRFRGREMAHTNIGLEVIKKFMDACSEVGSVEKEPKLDGRNAIAFLAPRTEFKKA